MKKITCEMCGSSDMLKQDGAFVCQVCGTKYSVEEAKNLMVEVDGTVEVTGAVAIDNANQINSYYDLAEKYLETDINKSEEYCDKILEIDSKNYSVWLLKFKIEHYKCNEIFNDDSTHIYNDKVSRRLREKDIWGKDKYEYIDEEIESQSNKANQYLETAISLSDIHENETIINEVYDIVSLYSETLFKMIQLNKGFIYETINYFFNCPYKILLEFVVENYNEDETIVFVRRYIDLIKNHIELLFNQSIKSESPITAIHSLKALMFLIKSKSEYVDLKKYNVDIEEWLNLYRQLRVSKTIIHCISEMESSKLELETTEDDEMYEWRMYDDETAYKIFNRNKKWLSYLNKKYIEQDIPTELKKRINKWLKEKIKVNGYDSVETKITREQNKRIESTINMLKNKIEQQQAIINQQKKATTSRIIKWIAFLILLIISIVLLVSGEHPVLFVFSIPVIIILFLMAMTSSIDIIDISSLDAEIKKNNERINKLQNSSNYSQAEITNLIEDILKENNNRTSYFTR